MAIATGSSPAGTTMIRDALERVGHDLDPRTDEHDPIVCARCRAERSLAAFASRLDQAIAEIEQRDARQRSLAAASGDDDDLTLDDHAEIVRAALSDETAERSLARVLAETSQLSGRAWEAERAARRHKSQLERAEQRVDELTLALSECERSFARARIALNDPVALGTARSEVENGAFRAVSVLTVRSEN